MWSKLKFGPHEILKEGNFSYLQDNCAPDHVECSKEHIFVIILPVKQIIRHSNQGHWYQGKGEVLQKAKVKSLALTVVVSDIIWTKKQV